MSVKFRLKIGAAEAEFEGDPSFLTTSIPSLIAEIAQALGSLPGSVLEAAAPSLWPSGEQNDGFGHSTNTIASLTDVKSGPELALSAAAHLTLVKGQDRFSRKELLAEMQGAATFYNQNYSSNLSKILTNLTRGKRMNLVGTNTYALPRIVREEYEQRLKDSA